MSPSDPPGPLFVLPRDPTLDLSGAYISTPELDGGVPYDLRQHAMVLGRPDGSGYVDIATMSTSADLPEHIAAQLGDDSSSPRADVHETVIDGYRTVISDGPAGMGSVLQQRGGWWIDIDGDLEHVTPLLEGISVDAAGRLDVSGLADYSTLYDSSITDPELAGVETALTYLDVTLAEGSVANVETATGGPLVALLVAAGTRVDRLEPTTVAGVDGWSVTRTTPEETWTGLIWQATPHRLVAISGSLDPATLLGVAEQLEIVTEQEWKARLPDYHQED